MIGSTTNSATARSIASLEAEVASVAEELYKLFAEPLGEGTGEPSVSDEVAALDRYVRRVGRIGMVASANGYRALRDACVAFQDRLNAVVARVSQGERLTVPRRELLEAWPVQLMACLTAPPDPLAVDALIGLLRSEDWLEPLAEAEAKVLRDAFLPDTAAPSIAPAAMEVEATDATTVDAAGVTQVEVTDAMAGESAGGVEVSEPDVGPEQSATTALQHELTEMLDGLFSDLGMAGGSAGAAVAALQLSAERTELMGMSAAAAGFLGLMDVCMLFQGALLALAGTVDTADAPTGIPVEAPALDAIDRWARCMKAYLATPGAPDIVDALLDAVATLPWGSSLGDAERITLHQLMLPEQTELGEGQGISSADQSVGGAEDEGVTTAFEPGPEGVDIDATDAGVPLAATMDSEAETSDREDDPLAVADRTLGMPVDDGPGQSLLNATTREDSDDISSPEDRDLPGFGAPTPAPLGAYGQNTQDDTTESVGAESTAFGGHDEASVDGSITDALSDNSAPGIVNDVASTEVHEPPAIGAPSCAPLGAYGQNAQDDTTESVAAETATFGGHDEAPVDEYITDALSDATAPDVGNDVASPEDHEPPAIDTPSPAPLGVYGEAPDMGMASDDLQEPPEGAEQSYSAPTQREASISTTARELIELLYVELGASTESLGEQLSRALDGDADADSRRDALDEYLAYLEPFVMASESLGLVGLSDGLGYLQQNVEAMRDEAAVPPGVGQMLRLWPTHVLSYLDGLGTRECAAPFITLLSDTRWPHPLQTSEAAGLEDRLLNPLLISDEEADEPRQTAASPDDVSLALPDDVNPQLLDSLLQELPNETAEFTEAVSRMLAGGVGLEELDRAQRIAHTLKGSANTVGVVGIATLTHHIEDILLAFSKQERLPSRALLEVLIDAADVLEMMSEALVGTGSVPDDQAQAVLQRVLDWANQIDANGLPEEDAAAVETAAPSPAGEAAESESAAAAPAARAEVTGATLRVPASLVDELLRLAGESIILNGQLQDRLQHALRQTEAAREQNSLVQQLVTELEELVDIQGLNSPQARAGLYEKFDALELEQYNELHTVTHRLVEATTDAREFTHGLQDQLDGLAGMLVDQGRLNRESQETVMRTRMVPVQNIVPRLQRSVRQTGRLTGKQALLDVSGVETLMDSDVLNELADPLMHILRNAVDHGIEAPERRAAVDKDPVGHIDLSFYREGDHIVLRCRDDGAGLDLERIRRTARERGLIDSDAETDDTALMRLVWLPGFSTRDVTTQTSGRGIGMDAVYTRVTELKGTLSIDSKAGEGCTVELRLPLTLISVHALLVNVNAQVLAISTRGIEQILHPGDGSIERDVGQLFYRLGDARYEAHYIETLLHRPVGLDEEGESQRPVLLVRGETGRTSAILVAGLAGSQDLVVKQLGHYLPPVAGIEGATILGDGSVAPVLDMAGLLRTAAPDSVTELAGRLAEEQGTKRLPCALVVDDSLSARRSLAQFVQDAGYDVRTARDGLEAIDVIADRAPDILLVDLEMPRMNGLELTAHVRARTDLREVPIIMVTSRSTEKHRQQAEEAGVNIYLTKPFSEDELLAHITDSLASA